MGYWNTSIGGKSFDKPGLLWGDTPADHMDHALDLILEAFQQDIGRPPSAKELMAGLKFSMNALVDEGVLHDEESHQ